MQDRIAFNQFLAETNKLTRIVLLSVFSPLFCGRPLLLQSVLGTF